MLGDHDKMAWICFKIERKAWKDELKVRENAAKMKIPFLDQKSDKKNHSWK